MAVALNDEEIWKHSEKITKIKPFISKCKWEGMNFLSEKYDWKTSYKNYLTIGLNLLYVKTQKIYPIYVSKYNSNR